MDTPQTSPKIRLLAALLLAALALTPFRVEAAQRIAVLLGSSSAPFTEAFDGLQAYLNSQGIEAEYDVYRMSGNSASVDQAVRQAREKGAAALVTIGTSATESAIKNVSDVPIIACLVMRLDVVRRAANATGIGLEFPLEIQFDRLQAFLPNARTIGFIYNPAENGELADHAMRIAQGRGLRLATQKVFSPRDVPAAINALSRTAEVILSVPDSIAYSPQMAKPLLLFSFRNAIPLVGLSSNWVKAGALYALDWDFNDLGAQAGEMVLNVLRGTPTGEIPPATPRKVLYSLNLRTADQMRIIFPEQVLNGARHVY